ncbi:MAG: hypothetical protein K5786_02830 [Treponema sp.]|nr:hypothetical protein [Treponema sp.]
MKNQKSKFTKKLFAVIITLVMICGISYAKPASINSKLLIGTWFWSYGYNPENFSKDEITFNKDKTMEIMSINSNYTEYDKGVYSIINDEKYGPTILLHLQNYKEHKEDEWQKLDIKMYFAIESIDNDKFIFHRYRRDLSNIGYGIVDFDPPVYNEFTKIKPAAKENLIGSWTINKYGTPDCTWDENWTFNNDGSFESSWTENEVETLYKGKYEITKSKNGSVLHQIITQENPDNTGFSEVNPPMEFWYDIKVNNENLINASCIKNKIGGEEHSYTPPKENFYNRNLDLVCYTYHFANYTFKDYAPRGTEYDLIKLNKPYLFTGVYYDLLRQHLEGWYDNQNFKGQPVKTISAGNNTEDREFWADWHLTFYKNLYDPEHGNYNHDFTLPLPVLESHMEYPETAKIPAKGEKYIVVLTGNLSKDIDIDWGLRLIDRNNNEWNEVAWDWHHTKTTDKKLIDIFELEIQKDITTDDFNKIHFNMAYNPDQLDEVITIGDFRFEILDKKSESKIVKHSLHYGNFTFKQLALAGKDLYLPENPDRLPYITNFWTAQNNEFLGWYDNPDFKGKPVTMLSASDNTKAKDLYGKYNLKFSPAVANDNGYYSNRNILVKSVIPNAKINPKAGDIVKVAVSGTLSKDYAGQMGMDLANVSENYAFLGNDWHYVESKNKKLQAYFEIKIQNDANYKTMDDASFLLACNPLTEGEQLIISDFKFEFVDKDPFATTEAETKHVVIKPCSEGFEITFRKLDSETADWQGGDININNNPAGYDSWFGITHQLINEKKSVTFVWPFCQKGKTYKFDCSWYDENGKWHGETLSVIASTGKGDLNVNALDNMKLKLESNTKEANLYVSNLKIDSIMAVTKNHSDIISSVQIEFPFVSGKADWSNTNWLFGHSYSIYPQLDEQSFYNELIAKGKSNILGDHHFWWGDKVAINNALSARPQFWTELRIHYRFKNMMEGTYFSIGLKRVESPYTPVKF